LLVAHGCVDVKRIFVGGDAKFKIVGTWTSENADKIAKSYNVLPICKPTWTSLDGIFLILYNYSL